MTSPIDDLGWLMEEPYYLRPDEIAKLTDLQIIGLYGKPRDEKGVPKTVGPDEKRKYRTPEEAKEQGLNVLTTLLGSREKAIAAMDKARVKKGSMSVG